MIIHHSLQLLEQISEVEERIQALERLIDALGIECDREKIIELIMARRP